MTRIAVIADTHDRVPERLLSRLAGAEALWHLGDVCCPTVLDQFLPLACPIRVVRGNCDSHYEWPMVEDFELEGSRIRLTHIPPARAPEGFDLLLHGHTHVPRNESVGGVRFLNPGCLTRPNRGAPASFAWLVLDRGQPAAWEIVRL